MYMLINLNSYISSVNIRFGGNWKKKVLCTIYLNHIRLARIHLLVLAHKCMRQNQYNTTQICWQASVVQVNKQRDISIHLQQFLLLLLELTLLLLFLASVSKEGLLTLTSYYQPCYQGVSNPLLLCWYQLSSTEYFC